nr:reverse transcriptase domain-containing protein [Tanacetum cinerariifolium]
MANNRTMKEMLQAPTEGYGDAIVVLDILAENFEIRTSLLSLIQANQFHGFESNNPHDHIRSFNRITSTLKFRDNQINNVKNKLRSDISNQTNELRNMMASYFQMNTASSLGSGLLPSNTVPNPRADLKAITTRSGVTLAGPLVSSPSKEVDREPETIMDQPKPTIPYPSRANKQKLRKKDDILTLKFVKIFRNLHFKLSFADALLHMPKFALMFKSLFNNKEKLFDLATTLVNENCSAVILKKLPEKLGDPGKPFLRTGQALIDVYGEELTLCVDDEAITFNVGQTSKYSYNDAESINRIDTIDVAWEENRDFLRIPNELFDLDDDYYDTEWDILYLEKLLNEDPSSNFPPVKTEDLKQVDATMTKPSIEEPPDLELKELPSHLEYAFLEETDKLLVIISKELEDEEKSALLKVLKSHKRAISWKISDIKGAKNLAADQLCRLENPHQDELEKKEIIKTFPLETLGVIAFGGDSSTLWFADFANYHAKKFIVKEMSQEAIDILMACHNGPTRGIMIFSRKLKTRWTGPFTVAHVFPYGTIELPQADGPNFKVNGHRLKHYFGGDIPQLVVSDLQTFPMDQ